MASRRRGPSRLSVGSCFCPAGGDQPGNAVRPPLAAQNGPAPPRARNSVGFADGTPIPGMVQAQRAALEAQQSTSKAHRPAAAAPAAAPASMGPPPSRGSLREAAGGAAPVAAAPLAKAAPEARQHYPRYGQPSPGDEEEVAERAPQPEDEDVALDWNLYSARRAPEADASVARVPARAASRANDPELCTPAVPIHGGQCGFATNIVRLESSAF